MLPEIESLLVLQDRDQRITSLESDLKRIPEDKHRAQDRLANDQANLDNAKKTIQENEIAIKNIELDIGTRKDTLAKLKTQQYETKKNDEFTALGNEIERYNQQVDDLETQELELMEKADELRAHQDTANQALARTQELVDEEIAQLTEREQQSKTQVEEVKTERAALATAIDEELLSLYDRLMKSKGGNAVVAVNNSQCSGCHMKLVTATLINVKADKDITQCENCGRILYL